VQDFKILEGAENFRAGDGPVGALLVHGYTGSPQSMRALGDHLAATGITVVGPRLPGHGTTWQDLNQRRAEEWVETVDTAFHGLALECDEVFLVGLSFGVALCLDLAARYPDKVAGIVTMAGMVETRDPRRHLAPIIRRLAKSLPGVANDIADPEGRELAYDRIPTEATYLMLRFLRRVRLSLPAVTAPILIMHSHKDHTVHPSNAELIKNSVSSSDKEVVWLDRSYHVLTLDLDRAEVFNRTYEFIRAHSRHELPAPA
jgi:carboxylesterase